MYVSKYKPRTINIYRISEYTITHTTVEISVVIGRWNRLINKLANCYKGHLLILKYI